MAKEIKENPARVQNPCRVGNLIDLSNFTTTVQDANLIVHRLTIYKGKELALEYQPLLVVYQDESSCLVKNEVNESILLHKVENIPTCIEKSSLLFRIGGVFLNGIVQDSYWDNGQVLCHRVYSKSFEKAKELLQLTINN